jgi:hypothetical protein
MRQFETPDYKSFQKPFKIPQNTRFCNEIWLKTALFGLKIVSKTLVLGQKLGEKQ